MNLSTRMNLDARDRTQLAIDRAIARELERISLLQRIRARRDRLAELRLEHADLEVIEDEQLRLAMAELSLMQFDERQQGRAR